VTVEDEGHHEIFALNRNAQVDEIVTQYLVKGTLPEEDVSLPGMPRPDIAPGQTGPSGAGTLAEQIQQFVDEQRLMHLKWKAVVLKPGLVEGGSNRSVDKRGSRAMRKASADSPPRAACGGSVHIARRCPGWPSKRSPTQGSCRPRRKSARSLPSTPRGWTSSEACPRK